MDVFRDNNQDFGKKVEVISLREGDRGYIQGQRKIQLSRIFEFYILGEILGYFFLFILGMFNLVCLFLFIRKNCSVRKQM